jgi:hypothetical protein
MLTKHRKTQALEKAFEIAKEHARSGHTKPEETLKEAYNLLCKIFEDVESAPETE